jgi:imidazolonepropionase-like amidohydrolase
MRWPALTGRNYEELTVCVRDGQDPMAALESATSISTESMSLGGQIGSTAPGMPADIVERRPLEFRCGHGADLFRKDRC